MTRCFRFAAVTAAAAIVAVGLLPATASARSERTVAYRLAQVWPTAVRFLRVDRRYEVTDRDKEAGFILFVYPGRGAVKRCRGALEVIPVRGERGDKRLRLQLTIDHQPSYVEVDLLDRLERKLREEHGPPREGGAPPPKDKPRQDEGEGGGGKEGDGGGKEAKAAHGAPRNPAARARPRRSP